MPTTVGPKTQILDTLLNLSSNRESAYVCLSNVHMCVETWRSQPLSEALASADFVLADGKPIYLAQKLLGQTSAEQYRGADLTLDLCERAASLGITVGFYGSTTETLQAMTFALQERFPLLNIGYTESPPFGKLSLEELERTFNAISESNVQLLFVGLGCPKQELWMAEHSHKISAVSLGVGAAFDFISGAKSEAPGWAIKLGLEWLHRLISEPKRLWRRYLITNSTFIILFSAQWFRYLVTKIRLN